jgi:predicted transcriptional regulator
VAVAALLELSAVIITEGAMPDAGTIEKANQEGIVLLSSELSNFEIVGRLWELGLRAA